MQKITSTNIINDAKGLLQFRIDLDNNKYSIEANENFLENLKINSLFFKNICDKLDKIDSINEQKNACIVKLYIDNIMIENVRNNSESKVSQKIRIISNKVFLSPSESSRVNRLVLDALVKQMEQ